MENISNETIKIASPSVLRQAARVFAATLAATPQFQAFEAAGEMLDQDTAAGDLLSEHTGLNFGSSACASGCCG